MGGLDGRPAASQETVDALAIGCIPKRADEQQNRAVRLWNWLGGWRVWDVGQQYRFEFAMLCLIASIDKEICVKAFELSFCQPRGISRFELCGQCQRTGSVMVAPVVQVNHALYAGRDAPLGEWNEIAADDQPIALEVNPRCLECQIQGAVRFVFSDADRMLVPASMCQDPWFGRYIQSTGVGGRRQQHHIHLPQRPQGFVQQSSALLGARLGIERGRR